jgi:hypothetical protein
LSGPPACAIVHADRRVRGFSVYALDSGSPAGMTTRQLFKYTMALTKEQIHDAFVAPGHMTEEAFETIVAHAAEGQTPFETVFIREADLRKEDLGRGLANAYGVPYSGLTGMSVASDVLELIPESVARAQQTVFFDVDQNEAKTATAHPDNHEFLNTLRKFCEQFAAIGREF